MAHVSISMAPSDGNICLMTITSKNHRWLIPSLSNYPFPTLTHPLCFCHLSKSCRVLTSRKKRKRPYLHTKWPVALETPRPILPIIGRGRPLRKLFPRSSAHYSWLASRFTRITIFPTGNDGFPAYMHHHGIRGSTCFRCHGSGFVGRF
jgi:hypothetical protein